MGRPNRLRLLSGIGFLLIVAAVIALLMNRPPRRPPPSAPGYYTGPMKSKGNPNLYGTDAGVQVPAPVAGAPTSPAAQSPGSGRGGLD